MSTQENGIPADVMFALPTPVNIVSSTNATPINIHATAHGRKTGDVCLVQGHKTNTNANGPWSVTVVDADNLTLDDSTPTAAGGATGTIQGTGFGETFPKPSDGDAPIKAADVNPSLEELAARTAFTRMSADLFGFVDEGEAHADTSGVVQTFSTSGFVDASAAHVTVSDCIPGDLLTVRFTGSFTADDAAELRAVAVQDTTGTPLTGVAVPGARSVPSASITAKLPIAFQGRFEITALGSGDCKVTVQGKCATGDLKLHDAWCLTVTRYRIKYWLFA